MSIGKLSPVVLATCGALAGGLVFPVSSLALTFSHQLTGSNTPSGSFAGVHGIATDAHGNLYLEVGKRRAEAIEEFSPEGKYLEPQPLTGSKEPFTGSTLPASTFGPELEELAIDPATGDVYVSERHSVDEFASSGSLVNQLPGAAGAPFAEFESVHGLAVDSDGNLYVADVESNTVAEFDASGKYLEPQPLTGSSSALAGLEGAWGVAVDDSTNPSDPSAGDLYVSNVEGKKVVDRFSPSGELRGQIEGVPPMAPIPGPFGRPEGVAVDAQGNVYVADAANKAVDEFNAKGEYIGQLTGVPASAPVGGAFGSPTAVAVDSEENLYVADEDGVVDEFGRVAPAVLVSKASNVMTTSATANGSVNPNSKEVTTCQFEYGTVTEVEHQEFTHHQPCMQSVGEGEEPVPVSAQLTGLATHEIYYYRLTATSAYGTSTSKTVIDGGGVTTATEVEAFVTSTVPFLLGSPAFASNVTQFSATLNASIYPENAPVGYHFAYIDDAAYKVALQVGAADPYGAEGGAVVPTPDEYTPVNTALDATVPQQIVGLHPGTTYDFALVATGSEGTVTGPNETFTTPGIPLPVPSTGGVSGVSEGAVTLTGSVDPEGWETTYLFQYGTSEAYGQSWPTVPVVLGGLSGAQPVSVYVERLLPGTTYYYRVVATNAEGTVSGQPETFRTSEYPTSAVQETPLLTTKLSLIPPEKTTVSSGKSSKLKGKAKKRRKASGRAKGRHKAGGKVRGKHAKKATRGPVGGGKRG